jgi:hypothetical protein
VAVSYLVVAVIVIVPTLLLTLATAPSAPPATSTSPGIGWGNGDVIGAGIGAVPLIVLAVFVTVGYAVIVWIVTALACLAYNLAARWVGGIEIQVDRFEGTPRAARHLPEKNPG